MACHVTLRVGVIHAMEGSYHASSAWSVIPIGKLRECFRMTGSGQNRLSEKCPRGRRLREMLRMLGAAARRGLRRATMLIRHRSVAQACVLCPKNDRRDENGP